jgi:hypothetical protein
MSTELILNGHSAPVPSISSDALSVHDLREQINLIQAHMKENLKDGEHYGVIPGCGDKPALLKSGAEKLSFIFQFSPSFKVDVIEMAKGHREYRVKCSLVHRPSGGLVADADGSCSTMEGKYRFRTSERKCPSCDAPAIIKGKPEYGGGFICFHKKGGCGAKFSDADPTITGQTVGRVEHDNPADYYNTCLKMACKRALVAATLIGTAASDIFTQDIEEMDPELLGVKPVPVKQALPDSVASVFPNSTVEEQPQTANQRPFSGSNPTIKPPSEKQRAMFAKLMAQVNIPEDRWPQVVKQVSGWPEMNGKNVSAVISAFADNGWKCPDSIKAFEQDGPMNFDDDEIPF